MRTRSLDNVGTGALEMLRVMNWCVATKKKDAWRRRLREVNAQSEL